MRRLNEVKNTLWGLMLLLCLYGLGSCDLLEPDADVIQPSTEFVDKEVIVLATSPSFIDLNSKLQTNVPVRAAVTSQPQYGTITDVGAGIVQYTPAVGNNKGRDNFEFTLYTTNNEIIKRDTLIIIIENDSTNLPCNIYPKADYVHGIERDSILIDVTANDIICGGPVHVSIFKPGNNFPPTFGEAETIGNKIKYTPGTSFQTTDLIIYKLTPVKDSTKSAYGIVYITADSACNFIPNDDQFTFDEHIVDSLITLQVFDNDSLCDRINEYQIYLKIAPAYGQVFTVPAGFNYKVSESASTPMKDHFVYEVCKDGRCKTANVNITFTKDSLINCLLKARPDTVHIANNDITSMYLDVLLNDSICGELKSLNILKSPVYGTAKVVDDQILYQRDPVQKEDDFLEYELCNSAACSKANVFIKQKK